MAENRGRVEFCISMGLNNGRQFEIATGLERLAGLFTQFDVPVTVAVPVESLSLLPRSVVTPCNEIALLASPTWTGPAVSRNEMRTQVPQIISRFRERRIEIQAVVSDECQIEEYRELLPVNGIRVLRESPACEFVSRHRIKSREKSRGLYLVRATAQFPGRRSMIDRFDPVYRAKKVLHRAMNGQHTEHLAISLPRFLEIATPRIWRSIESFLKIAGRVQSKVGFETLNQGASIGHQKRQQSVLSSAA